MKASFDILPPLMFTIPFDINKHLAPQGKLPSVFEKEHIPEGLYVSMINEYHEKNDHIIFSNVEFEYESCDCEYPCSHRPWISGFRIKNTKGINCYFEDDEQLVIETKEKHHTAFMLNLNNPNLTIGDFHRIFKIHGIDLMLSHHALSLISTSKITQSQWLKFQKLNTKITHSTSITKAFEIIKEKYNISLIIYDRHLSEKEIGYSVGFKLPKFDLISDLSDGADNKNDGVISLDFDVARKKALTYLLNYLLSELFQYHSGSMKYSFIEWKNNKKHSNFI